MLTTIIAMRPMMANQIIFVDMRLVRFYEVDFRPSVLSKLSNNFVFWLSSQLSYLSRFYESVLSGSNEN